MEPPAFWLQVTQITDGNAKPKFDVLSELMCTLVALPHSSACVERIFSQVNIVKTKQCNKLMCETVSNRLLARQAVKKRGGCQHGIHLTIWWKMWRKDVAESVTKRAWSYIQDKRH
jgi:hypothetical protein